MGFKEEIMAGLPAARERLAEIEADEIERMRRNSVNEATAQDSSRDAVSAMRAEIMIIGQLTVELLRSGAVPTLPTWELKEVGKPQLERDYHGHEVRKRPIALVKTGIGWQLTASTTFGYNDHEIDEASYYGVADPVGHNSGPNLMISARGKIGLFAQEYTRPDGRRQTSQRGIITPHYADYSPNTLKFLNSDTYKTLITEVIAGQAPRPNTPELSVSIYQQLHSR